MKAKIVVVTLILPLIASCIDIHHMETRLKQFCGFPSATISQANAVATSSDTTCEPRPAYCPKDPKAPEQNQFCLTNYSRQPGFNQHCAPITVPICNATTCNQATTFVSRPDLIWEKDCTALILADIAEQEKNLDDSLLGKKNITDGTTDAGEVHYYHYTTDTEQWLVFTGSIETCNWLSDLDYTRVAVPELDGMEIHRGFYLSTKSALNNLSSLIEKHRGKPLRIAGHSLGGAVAVISAMLLNKQGHTIKRVLTFGQPMVTNRAGVDQFNRDFAKQISVVRFINKQDAIPFSMWLFDADYAHFGAEIRLHPSNSASTNDFSYLEQNDGVPYSLISLNGIANHLAADYLKSMEAFQCKDPFPMLEKL